MGLNAGIWLQSEPVICWLGDLSLQDHGELHLRSLCLSRMHAQSVYSLFPQLGQTCTHKQSELEWKISSKTTVFPLFTFFAFLSFSNPVFHFSALHLFSSITPFVLLTQQHKLCARWQKQSLPLNGLGGVHVSVADTIWASPCVWVCDVSAPSTAIWPANGNTVWPHSAFTDPNLSSSQFFRTFLKIFLQCCWIRLLQFVIY